MTAKDSLAHTLNVVSTLRGQLETLRSDHAYFKLVTSETHGMMLEEKSSIRLGILLFLHILQSLCCLLMHGKGGLFAAQ